jgi:16S rRNA C967 or C1407 C5-methylase (RsmB/RsmF family)/NOL1/NOP2/fmu family ribosome biogenesis protein
VKLPEKLIESLQQLPGFNKNQFIHIHDSGLQVTSIRMNPAKSTGRFGNKPIQPSERVPWTDSGYYLKERPSFTFDPLFHAGCYYVQDASSMLLEEAIKQTVDLSKPLKVLDLCAAPGGKSTHLQSLISKESLLVSNEVIRARANILKDNIIKWGSDNVVVTNNDPSDFAKLENYFDLVVIDAPCSGSGLFRREPEAIDEWSEANVQLCSQRQQRILADIWPALKEGGILIYSTCSYSSEEDEEIVNWLTREFPIHYSPLSIHDDWGIVDTGKGYRCWPDKVKGEGFFLAAFEKVEQNAESVRKKIRVRKERVDKRELELVSRWVKTNEHQLVKNDNQVYAWPNTLAEEMDLLLNSLRVLYSGVDVGELMRDKFIPHHALALSNLLNQDVVRWEVDLPTAIAYLQRHDIHSDSSTKGWQIVCFSQQPLGWVNVLPKRVNNYYPKSLRILKDQRL